MAEEETWEEICNEGRELIGEWRRDMADLIATNDDVASLVTAAEQMVETVIFVVQERNVLLDAIKGATSLEGLQAMTAAMTMMWDNEMEKRLGDIG